MTLLEEQGAHVSYSDPYIPKFQRMRRYYFDLQSEELTAENISSYDCVLIATNHDEFDYELIKQNAQLIVDTRGVYREADEKIVKA